MLILIYMNIHRRLVARPKGFTIVELLVVIAVIGILLAVTIVSYNGVNTRARNATRIDELRAWVQIFEVYKTRTGHYPRYDDTENSGACLGTGFPMGEDEQPRCRKLTDDPGYSYTEDESEGLMYDLNRVTDQVPEADRTPVNGWIVGPWVEFLPVPEPDDEARINITTVIKSKDGHECIEAGFESPWHDDDGGYMCSAQLRYNDVTYIVGVR